MASESHIHAIARFLVGFGTEEDEVWRDYNLDFAGRIDYRSDGVPASIRPVDNSGYSLGSLQWDFGQGPELVGLFIDAFEAFAKANPNATPLVSDPEFASRALALQGHALVNQPVAGLRKQDVQALSEFVRSDDGSDWVNTQIDELLIGSDQQKKVVVRNKSYGFSLVGVARQVEETTAFKKYDTLRRGDVTDLLYAIGMKTYNQSQSAFTKKLSPFLSGQPSPAEIERWCQQFGNALKSGVGAAVRDSKLWSRLLSAQNAPQLLSDITNTMDTQCRTNPCRISKTSGDYVVAKQVFETPDLFERFLVATQQNKDLVIKNLFDSTSGAIAKDKRTGRFKPGLLVKNKIAYAWDAAGNAFKHDGNSWSMIPTKNINIKQL
jgi:hypothetical protein